MSVYRYATTKHELTGDLAVGHVVAGRPGMPAFPVRLADEVFQRSRAWLRHDRPVTVWDPCAGTGSILVTVGFLHRTWLSCVIASDADDAAVELSARNLRLLTPDGLRARRAELQHDVDEYGKDSHRAAVVAANRLLDHVRDAPPLPAATVHVDASDADAVTGALAGLDRPDIVIADVPYGRQSQWAGDGIEGLLASVAVAIAPGGVLALATTKDVKPSHPAFDRCDRLTVGHRRLTFFAFRG